MNLNDYILESVSDVDTLDIELAQLFAEMAVLEAMMNCYEKQIAILEYNEESANEIFTETAQLMIMEDAKYKKGDLTIIKGGNSGKYYVVLASDGKTRAVDTQFETQQDAEKAIKNLTASEPKTEEPKSDDSKNRPKPLYKANPNPSDKADAKADTSITPREGTSKQFDGSAAVAGPKKSWKTSLKKYLTKAASAIQQLVLGLIDSIFEVNFNKLAEKILDKGVSFEVKLNKNEYDQLHRLEKLIEKTDEYYEAFSIDKLNTTNWTRAEVNKYINVLREDKAVLQAKFYAAGAEDANDEAYTMNKDDFANLCVLLGKNEFKKKLRKCQAEASRAKIDYNSENGIPAEIGKEMREFVKYLIKAYNATTKTFTKVLKFAEDVGAKAVERSKNGGSEIGSAKEAKRVEKRMKAYGKISGLGHFDDKVNARLSQGAKLTGNIPYEEESEKRSSMTGVSGEVNPGATGDTGMTGVSGGTYKYGSSKNESYQYSMDLDEDFF